MIANLEMVHNNGVQVTGRVTTIENIDTQSGSSYAKLTLEDRSGKLLAFAWSDSCHPSDFCINDVVKATGLFQQLSYKCVLKLQSCEQEIYYSAIDLLPASLCSDPSLLVRLEHLISQITIPPLKKLVEDTFKDNVLVKEFLSVPASFRHHHSYEGGLFRHSIEAAETVATSTVGIYPRNEHQVAVVAALFHDLGKIWTHGKSFRSLLDHSYLNLEILAPRLAELDMVWRPGADMLRHMLVCPHDNRHDSLVIEEAIRYADRASAGLDARQMAFANEPAFKTCVKFGDRRYCRSQEYKRAA
ncbi:MAG: TraI domain-containing protein [Desulfobacteraceae bacterium]|nr:TraI domain-containing protein [Desulfobacteraceae bacterium]